jgi:hypothetical protein
MRPLLAVFLKCLYRCHKVCQWAKERADPLMVTDIYEMLTMSRNSPKCCRAVTFNFTTVDTGTGWFFVAMNIQCENMRQGSVHVNHLLLLPLSSLGDLGSVT